MMDWVLLKRKISNFEIWDDEELVGPSLKTIICAKNICSSLQQKNYPVPTGILTDGETAIVFEWHYDIFYSRLVIFNECAEINMFFDCRLIFKQKLQNCVI